MISLYDRTFLVIGFCFYHFDLEFLYGVQNSIALQAQSGRYAKFFFRFRLSNEKNPPKCRVNRLLKVHKIEIFFGFDFEICIISILVM
jgi:hypothetical protein